MINMQIDISTLVCQFICWTTENKENGEIFQQKIKTKRGNFSAENKEKKGKVFSGLGISISCCVSSKENSLYFSANANEGKKGQEF